MKLYDKIKWVLGILLVFVIVLTTNLVDKNNFNRIRNSIVTIYEDRIIANDLIFEISTLIQEKEIALASSDSIFFSQRNSIANNSIQDFINRYELTKLTDEERIAFNSLKNDFKILKDLERTLIDSGFKDFDHLSPIINGLKDDLYDLSKIQLKEGKRQMELSQRTMDTIQLFTQIEIIFLIVMAVLIQIIILYKPAE